MTGGSGNYQWSCDPEGIVGVASNGILTAIARGKTLVVAADTKNTAHFDETEVSIIVLYMYTIHHYYVMWFVHVHTNTTVHTYTNLHGSAHTG